MPARGNLVGLVDDERGDLAVLEGQRRRNPSLPGSDDHNAALNHGRLPWSSLGSEHIVVHYERIGRANRVAASVSVDTKLEL